MHDSLKDKKIRIEEPFDGTNTARAVYADHNFLKINFTIKHVAKVLQRAQESGANLYTLLEKDIVPDSRELEVII